MMQRDAEAMNQDDESGNFRITVTLPKADHAELCRLAKKKRVSTAWMVREAVAKLLDAESPLFRQQQKNQIQ